MLPKKKYLNVHWEIVWILLVSFFLYAYVYRGVFTGNKIIFPSNFLAQFYSPWGTQKFIGWDAGIPHKPIGTDQIRFFYPAQTFTNASLARGEVPLWNPYIFAGNAHSADVQSAVWYPLNALYVFLDQITAWQLLVVSQSFLAFVFMYMYVRVITANPLASWVSAIAFGLSGFYIAWSQENMSVGHAGIWLPLVLWSIENFCRSKVFRYIAIGSFALTMSLLAGFFQLTVYLYGIVVVYIVAKHIFSRRMSWSTVGCFMLMVIAPIGLSAILLIPAFEAYALSPRATSSVSYLFHTYLLPITHVAQWFSPDMYGSPGSYNYFGRGFYHETVLFIGLIPLLFAALALRNARNSRYIRFFLWASIGTFFLTQDNWITRALFRLPIPLLSTFLPSRILYLTTFSLSVLSGFGFDAWQKDKKAFPYWIVVTIALLFGACVVYAFALMNIPDNYVLQVVNSYTLQQPSIDPKYGMVMLRNTLFSFGVLCIFFVFTRTFVPKVLSMIGVIALIMLGQFYALQKYVVLGERDFLYPNHPVIEYLQTHQEINRFVVFGAPILGNISTQFGLYSAEGLDPMFSKRYGELVNAVKHNGKLDTDIPRIEVELSSMNDNERMNDNAYRLRVLNVLGVKYIVYVQNEHREKRMMLQERFPSPQFAPRWRQNNWHIFENTTALPRVLLLHDYNVVRDSQKILDTLFDPSLNLANTVILEEEPIGFSREMYANAEQTIKMMRYEPSNIEIMTHSARDEILVLSDGYHQGWHAYVDGRESKIYRANYAFRAVVVPKGAHKVTFEYKPTSFVWGYRVSICAVLMLVTVWIIQVFRYYTVRKKANI